MANYYYSLVLFLIFCLISCNNSEKQEKEISSLEKNILEIERIFKSLPTKSLDSVMKQHMRIIKKLKIVNYDSHTPKELNYFSDLYDSKKVSEFYFKALPNLNKEISFSKQQLKKLIHDFKKNLISEKEFYIYLEQEQKQLLNLSKEISKLSGIVSDSTNMSKLIRKVDSILNAKR